MIEEILDRSLIDNYVKGILYRKILLLDEFRMKVRHHLEFK